MLDKILAVLSRAALAGFVAIVVGFVRELDLTVVVLICVLIACYDFWTTFRDRKDRTNGDKKAVEN
jgi:hypothetical protein